MLETVFSPNRKDQGICGVQGIQEGQDTDQPRLQVGENQMDDRQVLLGNLWITTLGNSKVLIAALTEASIAAPIVSNDQRSRRDGALDEPTERYDRVRRARSPISSLRPF